MTKQTINVGTSPNDNRGDSLRASFQKINANFTELYTALGLDTAPLNLGAFEFTGSVLSTTDSSAIVIDQATTITSNLTVGGDVLPSVANGGDLGSSARPWKSLYVSSSTIYIGTTSLGVDSQGNLLVGGQAIADVGTATWNSITGKPTFAAVATTGAYSDLSGRPTIPTLTSQLTNDSNFITTAVLGNGLDVDIKGSVFGDDSSLLVDAVDNKIYATELTVAVGNFVNVNSNNVDVENINGLASQINFTVGGNNNLVIENNLVTIQNVSLSVAGDITLGGNIRSEGNINIEINLADSTLRRWQFGEDGNLTFPDGTNYAGKDITLPQTTNGIPNKVSWNFSDIAVGSTTTSLEWNLLSSTFSEFLIGTSSAATPFYFNFDGSGQTLGTIDNGGIFGGGKLTFGSTAGSNAGDVNAIELKATNGDVYLTSTESVKITVDASDSSARVWLFDPTGELTLPAGAVVKTTSGHLTIKGQEYVFIDSATNGQINIGTSSGVGAVVLGSKSRGTNVVVDDLQVEAGVYEFFSSLADATGVVTHNCANGHIFYHTSPDANWTVNLTNLLDTWNRATSVTLIITQGATGYIPNAVQIAGVAQTIKWQGNVTPTPSTNRTDVVTFSIINVSGTYIVLGQLTGF